jgi:hypothetical protein
LGNELAQAVLSRVLSQRPDDNDAPLGEIMFQDHRYIALLYAALEVPSRVRLELRVA